MALVTIPEDDPEVIFRIPREVIRDCRADVNKLPRWLHRRKWTPAKRQEMFDAIALVLEWTTGEEFRGLDC